MLLNKRLKFKGDKNLQNQTQMRKQIHLRRRSPQNWRVTLDHAPLNIFGPDTIPQLDRVITASETNEDINVVVFDSAVAGFFLTNYDFVAPLENTTRLPPGRL